MKNLFLFLIAVQVCLLVYSKISAVNVRPSEGLAKWRDSAEMYSYKNYEINYHDSKTVNKPVIVFLHGYPTSSWDWRFIWEELESDFRLVSLDMLGFGLSDKPTDTVYSIYEQADIYQKLLTSLSIQEAHFVAHDYGDIVAQELLARSQENHGPIMQSLAMLNGAIFPEAHEPLLIQKLLNSPIGGLVSHFNSRTAFGANLKNAFGASNKPTKSMIDDYWFLAVNNNGHLLNHKLVHYIDDRHIFRKRWVGATQTTNTPLLFINGVADPIAGIDMVERYIELVPDPRVIKLEEVGHYPHLEAPLEVANQLRQFLDSISAEYPNGL